MDLTATPFSVSARLPSVQAIRVLSVTTRAWGVVSCASPSPVRRALRRARAASVSWTGVASLAHSW